MSNQTIKNDPINRGDEGHSELENKLRFLWLGRRGSNPRMPGPKPGALPLGYSPTRTRDNLRVFYRLSDEVNRVAGCSFPWLLQQGNSISF